MLPPTCPRPARVSLSEHLRGHGAINSLRNLILAIARSVAHIRNALRTADTSLAGTRNVFGEEQLALDVQSDALIRESLCESRLVRAIASEELRGIQELDPSAPFIVVYDPLDGSSLVDANFSIGSIFGIYANATLIGSTPRQQVAALYALYGPRTILIYSVGKGVHAFLLDDVREFTLLRDRLHIGDPVKNYSPGNLRAVKENANYQTLMNMWLSEALTLRYSGCMVADVHHMFWKGQGIFTNVGGGKYPQGKLRLLYECGPLAYLVEQAEGASSDGERSLLDVPIDAVDQRSPIIIGSPAEVARVCRVLSGC